MNQQNEQKNFYGFQRIEHNWKGAMKVHYYFFNICLIKNQDFLHSIYCVIWYKVVVLSDDDEEAEDNLPDEDSPRLPKISSPNRNASTSSNSSNNIDVADTVRDGKLEIN